MPQISLFPEIENQDLVEGKEKWFTYDEDSQKVIEKVILTLRYILPCVCQK